MTDHKPVRFRRFLAFLADAFLAGLCITPLGRLASRFSESFAVHFALCAAMFIPLTLFVCRDFLLNGRSPGKRIFGLAVVDRQTGAPATARQLAIKAVFLFFYAFDGLFLLFSGRSLAERASNTAVIRSREPSGPLSKKRWIVVIAAALVLVLALCGTLSFAMNAAKDAEGYQPAHDYLTSSSTFAALGADSTDAQLTAFSFRTSPEGTVQSFQFQVRGAAFTVVCHPTEDGTWQVCTDCTEFE